MEEINLEIPPNHKKGYLNTIEGVISRAVDDLKEGQDKRKVPKSMRALFSS